MSHFLIFIYFFYFLLALSTSANSSPPSLLLLSGGIYSAGSYLRASHWALGGLSHEINSCPPPSPPSTPVSFCCFCSRLNSSCLNVGDENYTCCYTEGLTAQIPYLAHFGVTIAFVLIGPPDFGSQEPWLTTLVVCSCRVPLLCPHPPSPGFPAGCTVLFGNGSLTQLFVISQLGWLNSAPPAQGFN